MPTVFISVGSNFLPLENISLVLKPLRDFFGELTLSSVYESEAVGFTGDHFYNLVIAFDTSLSFNRVIKKLKDIETAQGRTRATDQVIIDLDVLLYGDLIDKSRNLPRSDITKNAFVLWPLSEIAAHLKHPISNIYYGDLWKRYPKEKQRLRRIKNVNI